MFDMDDSLGADPDNVPMVMEFVADKIAEGVPGAHNVTVGVVMDMPTLIDTIQKELE